MTLLIWTLVVVMVPMCCAWIIGRWVYFFDIAASQQMLLSWIALVMTLLIFISRRWLAGVSGLVLVYVSFWPMVVGRAWSLPEVDFEHKPIWALRIVSSNINPRNNDWREDLDRLMAIDADVIVLLEVPPELSRGIRKYGVLEGTGYPYWAHRTWVDNETSPCFLLSRWPIERVVVADDPNAQQNQLFTKLSFNDRTIVAGLAHPMSPRSKDRWELGNRAIEWQNDGIRQLLADGYSRILLSTDLNAGPAQYRARVLASSGVSKSKPITRIGGTYPSNRQIPEAMMVQLDDVWHTGSIMPTAWSSIQLGGSDHLAVVVDFEITDE